MGSKLAAKEAVKAYNIPMVPGTDEAITDIPRAKEMAQSIGFPILIKASAGGGGKGMRIVEKESDFESQMNRAISEAISAFGDGSVFIEKYVTSPRHIEIQIMADAHGNVIHLFERECSIQRRHQKVVEEAPSSILTPELREIMGDAAIKVAKSCEYLGAGTVEFLLDGDHNFYFLEMNTRLQVEHPVTEMVTGIDIIREQINIASGLELSVKQEEVKLTGHSIEVRINAEDPKFDFRPSPGTIELLHVPSGHGIRFDSFIYTGYTIPPYYDSMMGKVIVHGTDRNDAINKMKATLDELVIEGVKNNREFCNRILSNSEYVKGTFDTGFIARKIDSLLEYDEYE